MSKVYKINVAYLVPVPVPYCTICRPYSFVHPEKLTIVKYVVGRTVHRIKNHWLENFSNMKFLPFFLFLWTIFACLRQDPLTHLNPDPKHFITVKCKMFFLTPFQYMYSAGIVSNEAYRAVSSLCNRLFPSPLNEFHELPVPVEWSPPACVPSPSSSPIWRGGPDRAGTGSVHTRAVPSL